MPCAPSRSATSPRSSGSSLRRQGQPRLEPHQLGGDRGRPAVGPEERGLVAVGGGGGGTSTISAAVGAIWTSLVAGDLGPLGASSGAARRPRPAASTAVELGDTSVRGAQARIVSQNTENEHLFNRGSRSVRWFAIGRLAATVRFAW